ncbi:MAG: domain S-box protein [Acidobacteria bacterium]|nr:domain S-box protein [Acidobacteriota bacterium]
MATLDTVELLAGGIAHDFDTLLNAIVGHTDTLTDCLSPGDPRAVQVEAIRRAAEQAATLTQQLLAFSRTQSHQPAVLNLNTIVEQARPMLQRLVGASIRFDVQLASDLASVRADAEQLEHILRHLVANARDAMPGGGVLTMATANVSLDAATAAQREVAAGDYVELSVTDTGVGIEPAMQPRLFEPFFTTKARARGTGLGLAIVHGVVTQSRGHINVQSDVGCGARFAIVLPATRETPAGRTAPDRGAKAGRGTETVLLLGDDPAVQGFIADVLRRRGYRLLIARDAFEGLRAAASSGAAIDLLITTGTDAGAAAEELRRRQPAARVLDIALGKPLTPDALARRVRAALA